MTWNKDTIIALLKTWLREDSALEFNGYSSGMRLETLRAVMHWKIKELERELKENE
jgi:hypothetical protein